MLKIGGVDYALPTGQESLVMHVMHAALQGDAKTRETIGMSVEDANHVLWREICQWQTDYFGTKKRSSLIKLLEEFQNELSDRIISNKGTLGIDMETYTFLEALKHPEKAGFRLTLPNLEIMDEDDKPKNEYDAVSLVLLDDRDVEVWIWGATTVLKDLEKKRAEDFTKMDKLSDILCERWGDEVKIVKNYVCLQDGKIIRNIDGRRSEARY